MILFPDQDFICHQVPIFFSLSMNSYYLFLLFNFSKRLIQLLTSMSIWWPSNKNKNFSARRLTHKYYTNIIFTDLRRYGLQTYFHQLFYFPQLYQTGLWKTADCTPVQSFHSRPFATTIKYQRDFLCWREGETRSIVPTNQPTNQFPH